MGPNLSRKLFLICDIRRPWVSNSTVKSILVSSSAFVDFFPAARAMAASGGVPLVFGGVVSLSVFMVFWFGLLVQKPLFRILFVCVVHNQCALYRGAHLLH